MTEKENNSTVNRILNLNNSDALASVVKDLCNLSRAKLHSKKHKNEIVQTLLPSRNIIVSIVEDLKAVLFPGYFGISEVSSTSMQFHVGSTLDRVIRALNEQVRRGLCFSCDSDEPDQCLKCEQNGVQMTAAFLNSLPTVQKMLNADVAATFKGDPAATSADEAVFCYPGIAAITSYRLAHELHLLDVPIIPRMITEYAHSITGIDIHPGASIKEGLFIDHGTGVVIGETCKIGKGVKIYQGVTLGAKSIPLDENGNPQKGIPRHPVVEDDVVIYSGATILGRVTIGRGSVIGGNVWLTRSVLPDSKITQAEVRYDIFTDGGGI